LKSIDRLLPTFGRSYKTAKIPTEAYNKLLELKQKEMEKVKQEKDLDKLGMLAAMDSGTFTGYLMYKMAHIEKTEGEYTYMLEDPSWIIDNYGVIYTCACKTCLYTRCLAVS